MDNRASKSQNIITTIQDLKQAYSSKINICTIIPASLQKYFNYHNPNKDLPQGLEVEQAALLEDIEHINSNITQVNAGSITTINLAKRFQRYAKKKRQKVSALSYRRVSRFVDRDLPDGVHLSEEAKLTCFNLIYNSAIRDLNLQNNHTSSTEEIELSSQEDSDTDWDFKRKPRDNRPVTCVL